MKLGQDTLPQPGSESSNSPFRPVSLSRLVWWRHSRFRRMSGLGVCLSIGWRSMWEGRKAVVSGDCLPMVPQFGVIAGPSFVYPGFSGIRLTHAYAASLRPYVNSLSRLWPVQMSSHSRFTFSSPRSRNCRKPRACLICPNTGSTVSIRNA